MRVVSLCPSLTESVFRLGRGETLVGRTKFCVQPHGAVDVIERVGGTKNPKLDRIVELRADLVLMNEEENRKKDAEALRSAGVRVLSTFARDVVGARDSLITIGEALDARPLANELAAKIDALAAEIAERKAGRDARFVYLIWREPLMAVGPGTYVDALLRHTGARNLVTVDERYPEIGAEALGAATHILLSSEPFPFADKHRDELVEQTGLPRERFLLVDGERLSWHGARSLEGLAYAEQVLGG